MKKVIVNGTAIAMLCAFVSFVGCGVNERNDEDKSTTAQTPKINTINISLQEVSDVVVAVDRYCDGNLGFAKNNQIIIQTLNGKYQSHTFECRNGAVFTVDSLKLRDSV